MNALNFIKEVETKFAVNSVKVNNMEVWPFLRAAYFFLYRNKFEFQIKTKKNVLISRKLMNAKNVFYGINNLFKTYRYFIFSDIFEIRQVEGVFINKLAEDLIKELGRKNVLLIENARGGEHFKHSLLSQKSIFSSEIFHIFSHFPLLNRNKFISNEIILKKINKQFNLQLDYKLIINKFLRYKDGLYLFLRIFKPKLIFLTGYYNIYLQALIYNAKKLGIETVELQHGLIDSNQPAYNVFVPLDSSFFPDYLFVFGENVKNIFSTQNYFINRKNIFSVGSMFINYINTNYKATKRTKQQFNHFRRKFKKIIAISSQFTIEQKLIEFLKKSSQLDRTILYLFVPRSATKDYGFANFPENIVILKDLNVYQIIKESDIHATVYSFCALEAPALGVPNILINIDNMAELRFLDIGMGDDVTKIINSVEEFITLIQKWKIKTKNEIMELHTEFFQPDHVQSLKKALYAIK